jgi:hypothetical protein
MMWFIPFQRHFEIWMVITQSLCDEMVKISINIDGNLVDIIPIPGFISASWVGAKQVITHLVMKMWRIYHLLRPYRPIDIIHHQRNPHNRYSFISPCGFVDGKYPSGRLT